jgi:hypothetical protein
MAKSDAHRSWYRIALANGQVVAASGEHMGEAVAAAEQHGKSFAAAVAQADATPIGDSVGKQQVLTTSETVAPTTFHLPPGALPQLGNPVASRRGWIERPGPLYVVEIQTDADHLVDLYLGLLERVPAADNLEIKLMPHFEDVGTSDVWLTSRVNGKKILRFLDDHDEELFGNGHLEIGIYVRSHKATLRLTEHKTVAWIADDRALAGDVTRWLKELDVPQVAELPTVGSVPHFHYRGVKSRGRKALAELLFRQRLRRVARVDDAARAPETAG